MEEKDKIKALIEAVRALCDEGYHLDRGDHFVDTTAISSSGRQFKTRNLKFHLCKTFPLEGEEDELRRGIQSLDRCDQADGDRRDD